MVPGKNGMFLGTVVVGGLVVGTWNRKTTTKRTVVTVTPFGSLSATRRRRHRAGGGGVRAAPRQSGRGRVSGSGRARPLRQYGGARARGQGPEGDAWAPPTVVLVSTPPIPRAPRDPSSRTVHGDTVVDEYAWMSDRDDPRLTAYLEAENAYTAARTAHVEPLASQVFEEIRTRTKETDLSVPVRHGGWWYYGRTVEGLQYGIAGRIDIATFPERPVLGTDGPPEGEQVVLDENVEAEGHEFFALGASDVSPDGTRLAFAVDITGDERYDLHVRDLATGTDLDDAVTGIGAGVAWSLDGSQVFYTRYDDAWRPFQVWRHTVGGRAEDDVLVHEETDVVFRVGVGSSRDDRWVVVGVGSSTSTEYRLIDAADPTGDPILVAERAPKVEYDIEPLGDELFVLHNRDRVNFEVARAVMSDGVVGEWEAAGPHHPGRAGHRRRRLRLVPGGVAPHGRPDRGPHRPTRSSVSQRLWRYVGCRGRRAHPHGRRR